MKRKLIQTSDGSHSIFAPDYDEHYHSIHGAIQESKHVFLKMGLEALEPGVNPIRIFEMGLGTGLNAVLTWEEARNKGINVIYTAIEAFPVEKEMAMQLNYAELSGDAGFADVFEKLHSAPWNERVEIAPFFSFQKLQGKLEETDLGTGYSLIYYDAFAPSSQPELWTVEIFEKLCAILAPGGILVTYCAKGDVRRAMLAAGLEAKRVPGPPGKREMLVAKRPEVIL